MSSVNPVGSTYNDQSVSSTTSKSLQEIGKTEFLNLLVAQLRTRIR